MEDIRRKVLALLRRYEQPCDVEKIRREAGIQNWNSVLRHCLELYMDGEVNGLKTSRGWVFWRGNPQPCDHGKPTVRRTLGPKKHELREGGPQ